MDGDSMMQPLSSVRVIEMVGIGPNTHASMLLAGMGADVLRIERPGSQRWRTDLDPLNVLLARRLPSVDLDLKDQADQEIALNLIGRADVVIEGFRPGVMERLGLGPDEAHRVNPGLVYGRMTGWGQAGPLAQSAGHDINYISTAGVLHGIRRAGQPPLFPFNLLADYAGGSLYLVAGVLAGVIEARITGVGTIVDAAMIDGAASLMAQQYAAMSLGRWDSPGGNTLDPPAPYYNVYETSDGGYLSVGAVEPRFYAAFVAGLSLDPADFPQMAAENWPAYIATFASIIRSRSRAEWRLVFDGADACVTAVLSPDESAAHEHIRGRGTLLTHDGQLEPGAAPRFLPPSAGSAAGSRAAGTAAAPARGAAALAAWGIGAEAELP
jgi:alpha-methylacyl-CoA racemase